MEPAVAWSLCAPPPLPGLEGTDPPSTFTGTRFSAVIVGDIQVEFRAELTDRTFTELTQDHLSYTSTRALVSGTAMNLARRAVELFDEVTLTGKIGDDEFTPMIRRCVRALGAQDRLALQPGMPNSICMMLRDQSAHEGRGVRLLVANDTGPHRLWTPDDVSADAELIRQADVAFLDGYSLLAPASRSALHTAAEIAHAAGTVVVFDLVPHDIDRRLSADDILPLLARADVAITEANTLLRVLGRPEADDFRGVRGLPSVVDALSPRKPLWLLRYGPGGMARSLAYQREGIFADYSTGYGTATERVGYGDRLTAWEVYWWLWRSAVRGQGVRYREQGVERAEEPVPG